MSDSAPSSPTGSDRASVLPGPGPIEDRIPLRGRSLREHAARGTIINAAFSVGLAALGALRMLVIAIFLTTSEFGLWGLIVTSLITVLFLKEVGLSDKFVQRANRSMSSSA